MRLNGIDQRLLGILQARFPMTVTPYSDIGLSLGIPAEDVIRRIYGMKVNGLIRKISPVLNARYLGYKTTLVAMRVAEPHLERAAGILIEHPRVSHAYEREHHFNLWFTLALPGTADIDSELVRLTDMIEAEAAFDLPMVRAFKLQTYFSSDEDDQPEATSRRPDNVTGQNVYLSPVDKKVINESQQDLPLVPRPFAEMSAHLKMDEGEFLTQCQSLLSRGVIRRFGAAVNHRRAGFVANSMTCWAVPAEKVEIIAETLMPIKQVSHCYERKTNPQWRYNLFAMIHGNTREQCQSLADKVSIETGLADYTLLYSTKEFKKTRVVYQV